MTVIQRTPDLGLSVRMQRLPQAVAPVSGDGGGGGAVLGIALFRESSEYTSYWDIRNPQYTGWRVTGGDVAIDSELARELRALVVGADATVEWSWSLDYSHMVGSEGWAWGGVSVSLQDGTALVSVNSGAAWIEDFMYAELTLTAVMSGEVVGMAVLRLVFNASNEGL